MTTDASTIHASAVLVGTKAVLIRGPSNSGKSLLVWNLIQAAAQGALPFARLIGDDRIHVEASCGRLMVRPASALAGLIEIRNLGIRRLPYEPIAVASVIVDLSAADAARYPKEGTTTATLAGITLPRLVIPPATQPMPIVLAFLTTAKAD